MGSRQGDIRKNLGFSRDTLRLYEKQGIISPEIDPTNGYRLYDDWQVNQLWDAKLCQAMGFSLREVEKIVNEDDLESLQTKIKMRQRELEHELLRQQLVLENAKQLEAEIQQLKECRERAKAEPEPLFQEETVPDLVFIAERKNHEFLEGLDPEVLGFAEEYWGCMVATFYFPSYQEDAYYWGFSMKEETYRELEGPDPGNWVYRIPGGRAFGCYLDAGDRGGFNLSTFDTLVAKTEERGLQLSGPILGRLICRTHEADGYHRFLHARMML